MPKNQLANKKSKRYGIWAWVGAIYGPIIFWILFVNLPKIQWEYVLTNFVHYVNGFVLKIFSTEIKYFFLNFRPWISFSLFSPKKIH